MAEGFGTTRDLQQSVKTLGNQYYSTKEYAKAAEVYSSIINEHSQNSNGTSSEMVREVLANRAAAYLELGASASVIPLTRTMAVLDEIGLYRKAIQDCTTVLSDYPPNSGTPDKLSQKVYYRLARSYYCEGSYDDALMSLDAFRDASGSSALDTSLRMLILEGQVRQNELNTPISPMQAFEYIVRVSKASDLQHPPMVFYELAFPELCVAKPPKTECKAFLANLVKDHHDEIMGMHCWTCWKCSKAAVSILHNPMSWLHLEEPKVIDFALPICQNRGRCDGEGRKFIQEEMTMLQKARGSIRRTI